MKNTTKNQKEVENFNALAHEWWDENGPMKPLHRLNPARIDYLKSRICHHFDKNPQDSAPLKNVKILDVGCGGGIVSEPLARLGADVTGIDAAQDSIHVARQHADSRHLNIDYRAQAIEDIKDEKFDVVLALEIVEHVDNLDLFLTSCTRRLKKDGLLILSTLNRNPKSFALGIIAAEYLLRWVPRGTHDWKKFLKPSELAARMEPLGLFPQDITGLVYNPLSKTFSLSRTDLDVNYFICFAA